MPEPFLLSLASVPDRESATEAVQSTQSNRHNRAAMRLVLRARSDTQSKPAPITTALLGRYWHILLDRLASSTGSWAQIKQNFNQTKVASQICAPSLPAGCLPVEREANHKTLPEREFLAPHLESAATSCLLARQLLLYAQVLEMLWLKEKGPSRDFYHGLIQIAAAFVHIQKGTPEGATKLFQTSCRYLEKYRPSYHGVNLAQLLPEVQTALSSKEKFPKILFPFSQ